MEEGRELTLGLPNAAFLAIAGFGILLANGLLLNPVSRYLIAGAATFWGGYLLIERRSSDKTAAYASLASAGVLVVFGGLLRGLANVAGIGLIIAGGVSFLSGLFRRSER